MISFGRKIGSTFNSTSKHHLNYPQKREARVVSSVSANVFSTKSTKFLKLSKLTQSLNCSWQVLSLLDWTLFQLDSIQGYTMAVSQLVNPSIRKMCKFHQWDESTHCRNKWSTSFSKSHNVFLLSLLAFFPSPWKKVKLLELSLCLFNIPNIEHLSLTMHTLQQLLCCN